MTWLAALLGAFVLLMSPMAARSADCPDRYRIAFADGSSACLTDYALAGDDVVGQFGADVRRIVPSNGYYSLAATPAQNQCQRAVGVGALLGATTATGLTDPTQRNEKAMQDCRQRARGASDACQCRLLLVDGRSPLTAAQFAQYAGASSSPLAAGPAAAPTAPPLGRWSADCPDRYRLTLADGGQMCLTEYALAGDDVVGQFGADVRHMVPSNGYYSIAATPALAQCKRAVGLAALIGATTAAGLADPTQRNEKALQDCRWRARGATDACQCKLIVVDGRSPLTTPQFPAYAGTTAAGTVAGAGAAPPAGTTAAATPPPGRTPPVAQPPAAVAPLRAEPPTNVGAVPPANTRASAPGATGPRAATPAVTADAPGTDGSAAEIAALRQELQSLRAEINRPRVVAEEPARKPRRARALVIGNGRYAHLGALPNPPRDAQAIAAKLRGYGIDVDLHLDLDRSALVRALSEFQSRAAGYDVNLLFYAGHGLQLGGINFIVPVDMRSDASTAGAVKLNTVALDDALDALPASTRVVFLDACRDNPLSRSLRASRSAAAAGLAPVSTVSGTLLSYATRDGSTAEDGKGNNSPYTTALLHNLDRPEDIALVLRRVRESVLQATAQRQEPWEYGSLVGDQLILSRLAR